MTKWSLKTGGLLKYRWSQGQVSLYSGTSDTLGPAILSSNSEVVLSSVHAVIRKRVQKSVLCWEVVPFSDGSLVSTVMLIIGTGSSVLCWEKLSLS